MGHKLMSHFFVSNFTIFHFGIYENIMWRMLVLKDLVRLKPIHKYMSAIIDQMRSKGPDIDFKHTLYVNIYHHICYTRKVDCRANGETIFQNGIQLYSKMEYIE